MTDPNPNDPLVCLNTRMVGEQPTCGEPESAHCQGCLMCPGLGNCVCRNNSPADKQWLAVALDAFARHGGSTGWDALVDVISHSTAEHHRANIAAAIAPLQDEIRRLTGTITDLMDAMNVATDPNPCWSDNNGNCPAHSYFPFDQGKSECYMARMKRLVEEHGESAKEDES